MSVVLDRKENRFSDRDGTVFSVSVSAKRMRSSDGHRRETLPSITGCALDEEIDRMKEIE